MVVAIAGFAGLGRLLGARSALLAATLGLGLAGAIASVLAVFATGLIHASLLVLLLIGYIALLWPSPRALVGRLRSLLSAEGVRRVLLGALCMMLGGALLGFLEAHVYLYESHDVLYFTPTLEMLIGDYLSPIRIFTYYPHEMASYHFLPSAVIAAVLALVPDPNIALAIQARFLLSLFVLGCFFYRIAKQGSGREGALLLVLMIAVLIVYGEELAYDLIISSFYYVYLLLCIGSFLLEPEREAATTRAATWSLLIIAKAPIFFVAAVPAVYFGWRRRHELRFGVLAAVAALVVANIVSWRLLPPPNGDLSPGLFNIVSARDLVGNAFEFYRWTLEEPIVRMLRSLALDTANGALMLLSVIGLAVYLFIKVYAIPLALLLQPHRWSGSLPKRLHLSLRALSTDGQSVCLYLLVSAFAWLAVRFGDSVAHTMHALFLAAVLGSVIVGLSLGRQRRPLLFACLLALAGSFMVPTFRDCPTCVPHWHLWSRRMDPRMFSLHLRDLGPHEARRDGPWYVPRQGESMLEAELRAALRGRRLRAEDAPAPPAGQIARWYPQLDAPAEEHN